MGKIKMFDKNMYNSIEEGLRAVMADYHSAAPDAKNQDVYTAMGLEQALSFLCLNNIPHEYTINTSHEKYKIVTLTWEEDGDENCLCWVEQVSSQGYCLLKYRDNWDDEMDIEGFMVLSGDEYAELQETFKRLREIMNESYFFYYVGTNEEILYTSFERFAKCFERIPLTQFEARSLKKNFLKNRDHFGHFPYHQIQDFISDYEVENGED